MGKISDTSREECANKQKPYKDSIAASLKKEKDFLNAIKMDKTGSAYKKILLAEEMIYIATLEIALNDIQQELLGTKNNDALNEGRKVLYKGIIYLEEIVTNQVDCSFSDLEKNLAEIVNVPIEKRYYLIRKMGLAIDLLIAAFGENSKWKWSFVELQGRFCAVAKNLIDMKQAAKDYFDPNSRSYETTIQYVRLIRKLLDLAAMGYRDKYELSTHRLDDMHNAINFLLADRRIAIALNDKDSAEEIKKKAIVWKDKMEADQKKGLAK